MAEDRFRGFEAPALSPSEADRLTEMARKARGAILTMTTLADSGHPGGSMSSIEMYLTLWAYAQVTPETVREPGRDRVVVSHGHTSPGAYSALGLLGFFDLDEAIAHFRQAGSIFEGHVERSVPGIEWSTGNLGQGLSAAVGMALARRLTGHDFHTFCLMGDGGQAKGQTAESRRTARKFGLTDLTVLVDYNDIEQTGPVHFIMPEDIPAHWRAAGWKVLEVDGHDVAAIYSAIHQAVHHEPDPTAVICRTVIGKGVPFMEGDYQWHGKALPEDKYVEAMGILGLEPALGRYRPMRAAFDSLGTGEGSPSAASSSATEEPPRWAASVDVGEPRTYAPGDVADNRGAWGRALADIGEANIAPEGAPVQGRSPIAVFDCDLAESVRTQEFWKAHPNNFFECGIQEHSTAATAGALSTQDVLTFWADFGVFAVDEVYNQQRLSDINFANLKLAATHCGIDIGEDGKTHQCIDYVGLLRNPFGWRVIVPADPNQTDRAARWMAAEPGLVLLAMGRSKVPVVTRADGAPAFAGDWRFEYGRGTVLRDGQDCALISMGAMTHRAVAVHDLLQERQVSCRVIDMPTPLALDDGLIADALATGLLVTYEDHNPATGLGASLALWLADRMGEPVRADATAPPVRLLRLGVTGYASSGKPEVLLERADLDPRSVADRIVGTISA
jgi:transketolase